MKLHTALTIAGSDCSGGAGIQADLKTMTMNGVYAMSVITALTAQNTTGVAAIQEVTPAFLGQQMDAVFDFCTAWGGPIILDYDNRKMVLMPFTYYLEHLCSPEEAEEIRKQIAEYKAKHEDMEAESE